MRWTASLVLAGCVAAPPAAPRPAPSPVVVRGQTVWCGGKRVELPASVRVLRVTPTEVIAASREVALSVVGDAPPPPATTGFDSPVMELFTDDYRPVYRIAYHDGNACSFRAVANLPATAAGIAVMTAVAGTSEPTLLIGRPRVLTEPALTVLLRQREATALN